MNTLTTTTKESATELIPQGDLEALENLERVVNYSRQALQSAGNSDIKKAVLTARAMNAIEQSITKGMLQDFKGLMNSPLGFKTDRPYGSKAYKEKGEYTDLTIKRCCILALLTGARMTGNEWNLLVGTAYFTKEFMRRVILEWNGLTEFEMEIGKANVSNGQAEMGGQAVWKLNGEPMELIAGQDDSTGRRRASIVVSVNSGMGPDAIRGKGESKMLRRVVAKLTGLNLPDTDFKTQKNESIETPKIGIEPDGMAAAAAFVKASIEEIENAETKTKAQKIGSARKKELEKTEWSDSIKADAADSIVNAADSWVK